MMKKEDIWKENVKDLALLAYLAVSVVVCFVLPPLGVVMIMAFIILD